MIDRWEPDYNLKDYDIIDDIMDQPISADELTFAIRKSKSGKASGIDMIPIEFYKHGGETVFNSMLVIFKGAVSYRFSQGLLTLMCNNSKLKADINFFFFLLRRQTSKVYNWLQKFTIQHPVALL